MTSPMPGCPDKLQIVNSVALNWCLKHIDTRIHLMHTRNVKRTTVFLTDDLIKRLGKAAAKKGINVAQLIRFYLSAMLDKEKT
jgi:predicted DNA binding CopG/RHH family protein